MKTPRDVARKLEDARSLIQNARITLTPYRDDFVSVQECETGLKIIFDHLGKQVDILMKPETR